MNDESGLPIGSVTPGRNAVDEALGVTHDPHAATDGTNDAEGRADENGEDPSSPSRNPRH